MIGKISSDIIGIAKEVMAAWGEDVKITNPGKYEDKSLSDLKGMRDAAKNRQEKRRADGKAADPKDTSLLRELNFAIRAKTGWGKVG